MTPEAWVAIIVGAAVAWGGSVAWILKRVDDAARHAKKRRDELKSDADALKSHCREQDDGVKDWVREYSASRVETTRIDGRLDAMAASIEDVRTTTHAILRALEKGPAE